VEINIIVRILKKTLIFIPDKLFDFCLHFRLSASPYLVLSEQSFNFTFNLLRFASPPLAANGVAYWRGGGFQALSSGVVTC
jgi:hypothetical protein